MRERAKIYFIQREFAGKTPPQTVVKSIILNHLSEKPLKAFSQNQDTDTQPKQ